MEDRRPASMKEFKERLGMRESSGNYKAKNKLGYLGKYQFGKMALQDAGYRDAQGNWTGKNGVKSEEDFLNSPEAQEKAMDEYTKLQRKYLKNYGANKYIGKEFKGVPVTESGLVAAAHLIGAKGLSKAIQKDEDAKDAFGTSASDYLKLFQNMNLDEKEDNMNKLNKLESLREGIKAPIKKEDVVDPATALGFQDGGTKDILSEMGLPELENRDQYVTQDDESISDLNKLEALKAELSPKEPEKKPMVRGIASDGSQEGMEEADKEYDAAEIASETPESPVEPSKPEAKPMTMADLESEYRKLMDASREERKTAAWATAATQIASMLDKFSARPVGIKPINFQAQINPPEVKDLMNLGRMKGLDQEMTPYQQEALKLRKKQLDLMESKQTKAPSFEEKEEKKAEIKQRLADKKEEKEIKKTAEQALSALDTQEQQINKALDMLEREGASTGPIDQYLAGFSDKGQKLRKALNNIALDKMVKMFSGMSKAIDSDAERRFFESTQPSMADYESVNIDTLRELKKNIESLRTKTKNKLAGMKKGEAPVEEAEAPMSEFVTMKAPNGQTARVRRDQVQKYLDKGAVVVEE